jgi:transposase
MTGSICEHVTDVDSAKIFAAIELSKASWLVALHLPSHDKISVFQVPGGDVDRLLAILERARETAMARGVSPTVEIHTCYEAGYDGFWLHRLLHAHGIHNQVVDSASIQVSRRHRNVKTDHTDAESLLRVLMAWHRGETKACSIVRVPTPEEEDLKRLHRSRETLLHERVRHVNRIRGLLCLQGIRHIDPGRDGWTAALVGLQTRDGRPFPVRLMADPTRGQAARGRPNAAAGGRRRAGGPRPGQILRPSTARSTQHRAAPSRAPVGAPARDRADIRGRAKHRGLLPNLQ